MRKFSFRTLAAAITSVALLGAGVTAAQVAEPDAERGSVVTDAVPEAKEKQSTTKPLAGFYAADLIGHKVQNRRTDSELGKVSNLVIDQDGNVIAVLVTGHAAKEGSKRDIAIGWKQMDRVVEGDDITLFIDMDEEALEALPEYAHN